MYAKNSVSAGGEIQKDKSLKRNRSFFIKAIMIVAIKKLLFLLRLLSLCIFQFLIP